MDAHNNFGVSTVATAPSPATSGTSLILASGEGARFTATPPYNCTVCPVGVNPTSANAEIVRVTARTTDTVTITRAQEGTSARTIIVGDQFAMALTNKTLTDIAADIAAGGGLGVLLEQHTASGSASLPFTTGITSLYDEYMIELVGIIPATDGAACQLQVSLDGGSTWETTAYITVLVYFASGGSPSIAQLNDLAPIFALGTNLSNLSSGGLCGSLKFFQPLEATGNKVIDGRMLIKQAVPGVRYVFNVTAWYTGGAVNAFRIKMDSGNIASGTVRLYGLKK